MPPSLESLGIDRLSVADRLELAQAIWTSVTQEVNESPLSDELKRELDRRWKEHEDDPESAIPWEDVIAELRAEEGNDKES